MNWFTAFVLYSLIWWVVLFAVLPIGVQPEVEANELSGWRGAPRDARMLRKLAITTAVAAVIWGLSVLVIRSPYLSFRQGWLATPDDVR